MARDVLLAIGGFGALALGLYLHDRATPRGSPSGDDFPDLPSDGKNQFRIYPETEDGVSYPGLVGDRLVFSKRIPLQTLHVVGGENVLVPSTDPYVFLSGTRPGTVTFTFQGLDGLPRGGKLVLG